MDEFHFELKFWNNLESIYGEKIVMTKAENGAESISGEQD